MFSRGATGLLLPVCCALVLGGCGGGDPPRPTTPSERGGASTGDDCGAVMVTGHEALEIRATGAECADAKGVAAAAEGRGRAPYRSGGFACRPSEAGDGDTNYLCSKGSARITFRYGTV